MTAETVSPLPTPPSRTDDEATFVARADAFVAALPAFAMQLNSLVPDINSALAGSGFRGAYDAGTTYAIGESVAFGGRVWIAVTENTAVEPTNGANWIGTNTYAPVIEEFTSSGNWTKPAGVTVVVVEAVGGGGGGENSPSASITAGASGGEYVQYFFQAADLGATETVTIGAGGLGGASGANTSGSSGGNTTFGAHLTALGGRGGDGPNRPTHPRAENAADNTSASFMMPGITGGAGGSSARAGGSTLCGGGGGGGTNIDGDEAFSGGSSQFHGDGGAGNATLNTKAGDGQSPGGGGGGSCNNGGGGDGGAGWCRVICW